MRDIGRETFDLVDAVPQFLGHAPQGERKVADLVAAAAEVGDRRRRVAPRGDALRRGGEPAHRPRQRPREIERQEHRHAEHAEREQKHIAPGLAHHVLHPRGSRGDQERAHDLLEARDGNADGQGNPPVGAAPRLRVDLAAQRRDRLGVILRPPVLLLDRARQVAGEPAIEETDRAAEGRTDGTGGLRRRQFADGDAGAGGASTVGDELPAGVEHARPRPDRPHERRRQLPGAADIQILRRRRVHRNRRLGEGGGDDPPLRGKCVQPALDQPAPILVEMEHPHDDDAESEQVDREDLAGERRETSPPAGAARRVTPRGSGSRSHTGSRSARIRGPRRGTCAASA